MRVEVKEKTADEMLEELDYFCVFDDWELIQYSLDDFSFLNFLKIEKMLELENIYEISPELHKAITKQMEELGWL